MAKNYDRDLEPQKSKQFTEEVNSFRKFRAIKNKNIKKIVYAFMLIAMIGIGSFLIPKEQYSKNLNLILLNLELFILFGKDLILYFKGSCKYVRAIFLTMITIYIVNIVDYIYDLEHSYYLVISLSTIVIYLSVLYLISNKKK